MSKEINLFQEFPDQSRIWLYQSDRALSAAEMEALEQQLLVFSEEWAAHGNKMSASAKVVNPYFSILVVNDELVPPTGCSVDTKVNFIKELGQKMNVNFFDRMKVTLEDQGELKQIHFSELKEYKDAFIYDPLLNTLGELRKGWPKAINQSSFAHLV
ncbi:MAG TPA: hypothetical protein VKX31_07915 [Brumimicrobium sp.]|nr:hypothetical protein [Brumimicrobium sp.]